jgi:mannose-6-phosphate isomerase-like protein (cupin superfamily)
MSLITVYDISPVTKPPGRPSMTDAPYGVAHVSEIVTPQREEPGVAPWRAVRRHFDIESFGIAAYTAEAAGEVFTGDHTEADTRHEELFFVVSGRAAIRVAGETVDAPAGTFVHVPDPEVLRGATALEPGTTLLAVGGEPGKAFVVSEWERRYEDDA